MKKRAQGQDKRPTRRAFHSGKRECRGTRQEQPEEKNGGTCAHLAVVTVAFCPTGACSFQRAVGFVSYFHKFPPPKYPTETTQMRQELFDLTVSEGSAVSFLAPHA